MGLEIETYLCADPFSGPVDHRWWLDADAGSLTELPQTYERSGELVYWYEAQSAGYEGLLEFSPNGFIRRYPGLWEAEPMAWQ